MSEEPIAKTPVSKFLDMKISIVTIVGWAVAIVGGTATISSMYGEQKQKLLYLAERQTNIELKLDRIEASQYSLTLTMSRLESELKLRGLVPIIPIPVKK